MLRSEAKKKLREAFPNVSICIQIDDWYFDHAGDKVKYTAVVFEDGGETCLRFEGDTLDEAVGKALQGMKDTRTEADKLLDAQFA